MSERKDNLLDRLGEEMAEELAREAGDPKWEALVRGEGDTEALRNLPGGERNYEIYRPLDEAYKSALTRQLVDRTRPAATIPVRPLARRPATWMTAATGLALAAVLFLVLRPIDRALPSYHAVFIGGDQTERAAPSAHETVTVRPSSPLRWLLRPDQAAADTPEVACYWRQGGDWQRLEAKVQISTHGAIRLQTTPGSLRLRPGDHGALVLVVASELPTVQRLQIPPGDADWQVFSQPLMVVPELSREP